MPTTLPARRLSQIPPLWRLLLFDLLVRLTKVLLAIGANRQLVVLVARATIKAIGQRPAA